MFITLLFFMMINSSIYACDTTKKILKIGHRGACGYEPENTLRSFRAALALKVDALELDVYQCASGELVVIHDPTVDRTTNGSGYVNKKTLQELKSLNAGNDETIPTLEEVFACVSEQAIINIELKGSNTADAVASLINEYIINKGWKPESFLISSFDHHNLKRFSELCPTIRIGALIEALPLEYAQFAQSLDPDVIIISGDFINQAYIDDAHARGMEVYVYTIDTPEDIAQMKILNVDGIISNYPDRL